MQWAPPAEKPVIRSLCSILSPSVCRCEGEILPVQLGARHHIYYVGLWALNAARARWIWEGWAFHGRWWRTWSGEMWEGAFQRRWRCCFMAMAFQVPTMPATRQFASWKLNYFKMQNADAGDKRYWWGSLAKTLRAISRIKLSHHMPYAICHNMTILLIFLS